MGRAYSGSKSAEEMGPPAQMPSGYYRKKAPEPAPPPEKPAPRRVPKKAAKAATPAKRAAR